METKRLTNQIKSKHNIKNLLRITVAGAALTAIGLMNYTFIPKINKQLPIQYIGQNNASHSHQKLLLHTDNIKLPSNKTDNNNFEYFRRIGVIVMDPHPERDIVSQSNDKQGRQIIGRIHNYHNIGKGRIKFLHKTQTKPKKEYKNIPIKNIPRRRHHLFVPPILQTCVNINRSNNSLEFEHGFIQAILSNKELNNILPHQISNDFQSDTDYLYIKLLSGNILVPIKKIDADKYTLGENVWVSVNMFSIYPNITSISPSQKITTTSPCIKLRK